VRQQEIAEITVTRVSQGATFDKNEEEFGAANTVDKDLSTMGGTRTYYGAGWLKVEFGKTHFVHRILIYSRFYTNWYDSAYYCAASENHFKKCVYNDNNVDVSVYQGDVKQKSCGTLQLTYGLEQSDQIYTLICNTEGNSVKLSKTTGNIAVYEIVITGPGKI
jgi:hypothetical protein